MFPRNENRNEGKFACSPGTKKSRRKKGFWAPKSQPEITDRWGLSVAPLNRNASLLSLVSEIVRFLGSAMGIAIANRKSQTSLRFRRAKVVVVDISQLPVFRESAGTARRLLC